MLDIIRSDQRGAADHGWLQSRHTFSFADYYNPQRMGFASLRVVNEDRVAPGQGFGRHPHRDMEILTYVIDGALAHKDSLGNGSVLRAGEVQRMTAGTGVFHSEYNDSDAQPVHFLQIWLLPERNGLRPGYEQKLFPAADKRNRWRLIASRDGRDGSLTVHQDAKVLSTVLDAGAELDYRFGDGRRGFVHVVAGRVDLDGQTLGPGDAAAIQAHPRIGLRGLETAELLLFDLA